AFHRRRRTGHERPAAHSRGEGGGASGCGAHPAITSGREDNEGACLVAAPLEGLRVLDMSTGVAGPYATKLLADYGADVIKVEPPGGDPSRCDGPFPGGKPDPEASGRFLFLNTNKRSSVLDLQQAGDREALERRSEERRVGDERRS